MRKRKLISVIGLVLGAMFFMSSCSSNTGSNGTKNDGNVVTQTSGVNLVSGTGEYDEETLYLIGNNPNGVPSTAKNRKDTLIVGIVAPNGVFNPLFEESAYDADINDAMWAPLLELGYDGLMVSGIAEMPEVSEDGKKYTFTLKEGVKWQDGTPITSEDIEFTFKVLMDKTYTGRFERENLDVVGWKDYRDGVTDYIAGFEIIDDRTFSITLNSANGKNIYYFNVKPLAKHIYGVDYVQGNAKDLEKYHRTPFGNGAYKFVSYKDGEEVVLVANENYYKGKPKIENLIFRVVNETNQLLLLQNGDIDVIRKGMSVTDENLQLLEQLGFANAIITENLGYGYIAINHKEEILQDVNVRKALAYGLDRQSVVEAAFGGQANVIDIPQSTVSWAYPDDEDFVKYPYDPEKAKQLLEEAGWKVGSDGIREKDGVKLSLKFLASSPNSVNDALVPIMIQNYKDIGIEVKAEQMEFRTLIEKQTEAKEGKFSYHLAFLAWALTPDPDSSSVFGTDGSSNKTLYSNPVVDELLKNALNEMDQDKRRELYNELYKELSDDLPYIFLYQRKNMDVYLARVKGMEGATPYRSFIEDLEKLSLE
ncbi:ABC transporter substrate-binding protein [Candidatus Arthromitus sp. SFB-turkey]|uniref:ABC transporter substrate-binding protein n=1 Tax=Candidatus Arthromitus sp. SFB-turkey TaxID=1840217 RepID=UPI0007F42D12|nr:ABC transporter substrate-binding protein [Candidatus Arthromitus sp. SFB-turkey]OAT88018.1 ABC transporter substrate-binding protein [Candidatus Arthromitus sp. SFB-turkey]